MTTHKPQRVIVNNLNALPKSVDFTFDADDNQRLANLCGQFDENLRHIERALGVAINNRANQFQIVGPESNVTRATALLRQLYDESARGPLSPASVHLYMRGEEGEELNVQTRQGMVRIRGSNQRDYVRKIRTHDVCFGIGPAGTGKTYLAVACAVEALERETVKRLILVRPAVEAGERLGYLPGDLFQKIDPYLRPLYDALYEMVGVERVAKLIERNVIEIAPLAYMRGRTLNDAFVILDEAQNATVEQMKMLLTRIGYGSVAVITGDATQVDLPRDKRSGLRHAVDVLKDIDGIGITFFEARDVVRHPLVQRIITAYSENDEREASQQKKSHR